MNLLAQKYVTKIEGYIPDLKGCIEEDDDVDGLRDAVFDFSCDYIYEHQPGTRVELVREAARDIAHHYCDAEDET